MSAKDKAAALEREVAEERVRVDATLEEIQRRLTPGQLMDEVLRHGRGTGTDFVSNLGRTLSANPIPTALLGVGLLWLLLAPKALPDQPPPTGSGADEAEQHPGGAHGAAADGS